MSNLKSIDLSIVIVNFNTKAVTLACLGSLYKYTKEIDFEVIVVDNASTDDSVEALSGFGEKQTNFKLICSKENRGFGVGNNLGAKEAKGESLLFLNSDTLLVENCLPVCLEIIRSEKKLGAVSINLLNQDLSYQPSGGYFPNLFRLTAWQLFLDDLPLIGNLFTSIHPHAPGFSFLDRLIKPRAKLIVSPQGRRYPDWVTGAFMMIPTAVFNQVGGFDEKFFMYVEEMELCYRIKKAGYKIALDSQGEIVHLGGASGGSHLAITHEIEGMLYFFRKHKPAWQLPLVRLAFFAGSLLRYVIFGIIMANATARKSYGQAFRLLA